MLERISIWFYRFSTGKRTFLFLFVFILFTILVLPKQSADAGSYAGDVGSPDLSFFYTPEDLHKMAEAYGEQGRVAYINARFTFDLIWPLIYALYLSTSISWIFKRAFESESHWRWANLAPIMGMAFDYLENVSTAMVMYRYPDPTNFLAAIAPFFTTIKWIFVAGSFGLLFYGSIILVLKTIREIRGEQ